jgi:hypothetical protein
MSERVWVQITAGQVVNGYVKPKSNLIETLANGTERKFSDLSDHVEVVSIPFAESIMLFKYDNSAETETVKTVDSFTSAGVDSKGLNRWWDFESGDKYQNVYDDDDNIIGIEKV